MNFSLRYRKQNFSNYRLNLLFTAFLVLFVVIDFKLFYIQVVDHKKYKAMALEQYSGETLLPSKRGTIFSSDNYVLAGTELEYLMYAEPKKIPDKYKLAHQLAEIITKIRNKPDDFSLYYDKFFKYLDTDRYWIGLERGITPLEKEKIEESKIEGIGFEESPVRFYPEGSLSSHVLGFVASNDTGEKVGYFGIEGKLNEDLKGRPGKIIQEFDATGAPILAGDYKMIGSIPGRDVVLTINRTIQYLLEKKIKEGVERYDAVSGTAIIMDPSSGEVLAMANFPNYSPGDFTALDSEFEKDSPYRKKIEKRNLAVSQTYEPGSVIKPFTIASAINLNVVTPTTTYEDSGPVWYSDYKIDNWDGKHYGTMTIIELLQKSNNIGASWVGHKVKSDRLYTYFSKFGFGKRTGIELEGEDSGILRSVKTWSDIDLANISFGQGMSATPLQVLNSFNALINGGFLLEPRVISRIHDGNKTVETSVRVLDQVISQKTSDTMVDLLEQAATGGEAKFFLLKNYRVGGKTGTAQIPVDGKYDPQKTNATFVGFLPGSRTFSMIVKLEEPHKAIYAAETAVPLWMEITEELVKYFGLPPDRNSN